MKYFKASILTLVMGFTFCVFAQSYPTKPIKIYIGYAPGGAVDLVARSIGQALSNSYGQSVVIENKPGAGTNIAMRQLIDANPDGYTLMLAANALAANMSLYKPQPFDTENDIAPIAIVGRVPVVIAARNNSKFKSVMDLIRMAKESPEQITYGSPGNGATPHMAMKFFEQESNTKFKHVPYKGGAPAITDLIGGQIDLVAMNILEISPHVKSGKLKILAVMSAKRSPLFPEVPTIAESGFPKFEASVWYGLIAPAKTPTAIINSLHSEVEKALGTNELKDRLSAVGGEVVPGSVGNFHELIQSEHKRYEKLVKEANIQPD